MAKRKPCPGPPMRLAAGIRQPSKRTIAVGWAFQPILSSLGPKLSPAVSASTTKAEIPAAPDPGPSDRAITT